jgi:ABC-type uncharacterized transport system substrate-binding protein
MRFLNRHILKPVRTIAMLSAVAGLLLSGCAVSPPVEELVVEIPAQRPIPIIKSDPEPPPEQRAKPVEPPSEPPNVAVVLTNRSPAYEDVAVALAEHFDDILIYDLADKSQPAEVAFRSINDSNTDAVVAIGLKAATASVMLAAQPVIFSQVFNFQEHELLTADSRGVAAFAPVDAQLAAWKDIQPTLSRVGLVIGPGHDALLEEAEVAADRLSIQLSIQIAHSDQESLFYFKRMVQEVDGFWLLPDNRVLSGRVLKEMLAQANRRGVSVLVPSRSMLSIGASISVSTVAADIAARIRDLVLEVDSGRLDSVPALTPLTEILVETNDELLNQTTVAIQDLIGLRP